jgi:hypothetical protein
MRVVGKLGIYRRVGKGEKTEEWYRDERGQKSMEKKEKDSSFPAADL